MAFPVDRLRWTGGVARLVAALDRSRARSVQHRELWITGSVSGPGRRALADHRWMPFDRAHQRLSRSPTGGGDSGPN